MYRGGYRGLTPEEFEYLREFCVKVEKLQKNLALNDPWLWGKVCRFRRDLNPWPLVEHLSTQTHVDYRINISIDRLDEFLEDNPFHPPPDPTVASFPSRSAPTRLENRPLRL